MERQRMLFGKSTSPGPSRKGLCALLLLALAVYAARPPLRADDTALPATSNPPATGPGPRAGLALLPSQVTWATLENGASPRPTVEAASDTPGPAPAQAGSTASTPKDGAASTPAAPAPAPPPFPVIVPWSPDDCLKPYPDPSGVTFGLGWWFVEHHGSPWVVGQWQDTRSSPFWDVDGLSTNGTRTFNYTATGTDNESTRAKVQYFGPDSQGSIDFNRFPHAQEHENFNNMKASALIPGSGPRSGQPVIAQDLNVGQDYAIRVDQFEAKYKFNVAGRPNKDDAWITAGINIWDQREFGDRQSNNTVHCFTAQSAAQQRSCHVLSQRQAIDWNTFEVTPAVEGQVGRLNVRFSNTMRIFSTNDQDLLGVFPDGGANILNGIFPYASVPQSFYDMSKLQVGLDLNDCNKLYAFGYVGFVDDTDRHVGRDYGGFDLRWTNTAFKGLNLTTYVKNYDQSGERPTIFLVDEKQGFTPDQVQNRIRTPVGFNDYKYGERFNWRPWTECGDTLLGRLSFNGGYEYDHLIRVNEVWHQPIDTAAQAATTPILFQPNTDTHAINVGVQTPWSDSVHTYARYTVKFISNDLVGFRQTDGAVNSSLPDLRNVFEFGAEWLPSEYYGASFSQIIDLASRSGGPQPVGGPNPAQGFIVGDIIDGEENSYSTSLTGWCIPAEKLTLTANAGYFTNRIKQNISIGDDYFLPGDPLPLFSPVIGKWTYGGDAVVLGCGANYRLSCHVRLTADYEISDGKNRISDSDGFATLAQFSAVRNVMHQMRAGVDWQPREHLTTYFRYQLVDFVDLTDHSNSGYLNMFLAGARWIW